MQPGVDIGGEQRLKRLHRLCRELPDETAVAKQGDPVRKAREGLELMRREMTMRPRFASVRRMRRTTRRLTTSSASNGSSSRRTARSRRVTATSASLRRVPNEHASTSASRDVEGLCVGAGRLG